MKRLMFLISTKGKSSAQVAKEGWSAYQKYQKVSKEVDGMLMQKAQPQTVEQRMEEMNSEAERDGELLANLRSKLVYKDKTIEMV